MTLRSLGPAGRQGVVVAEGSPEITDMEELQGRLLASQVVQIDFVGARMAVEASAQTALLRIKCVMRRHGSASPLMAVSQVAQGSFVVRRTGAVGSARFVRSLGLCVTKSLELAKLLDVFRIATEKAVVRVIVVGENVRRAPLSLPAIWRWESVKEVTVNRAV